MLHRALVATCFLTILSSAHAAEFHKKEFVVRMVQTGLIELGRYLGPVTGNCDQALETALRKLDPPNAYKCESIWFAAFEVQRMVGPRLANKFDLKPIDAATAELAKKQCNDVGGQVESDIGVSRLMEADFMETNLGYLEETLRKRGSDQQAIARARAKSIMNQSRIKSLWITALGR